MAHSRALKAATLGSGTFLLKFTGLVSAAVLSRIFTKTDYAAYRQVFLSYNFVFPLLILGLPSSLYYFLPGNKKKGRSILSGNLLLSFVMGAMFALAVWLGANHLLAKRFNNPALSPLLLLLIPYALVALPIASLGPCLISCDRVKTLVTFNVASRIGIFACVIALVLIWRTPFAAVSGTVVAELLIFFPAIFLMYRAVEGDNWRPTFENMSAQLKYSIPLALASLAGMTTLGLDKVLVSSMCTPEKFAVYVNGAIEIPFIGVITGSVMSILTPDFAAMYQQGENEEILTVWRRAMVKCALLILPTMVFLFIMAPEAMRVLFSAEYAESARPFRIFLLALPIRITTYGSVLKATGRTKLILWRSIIGLVITLFLSIGLIKIAGILGAAAATVLVLYIYDIPFNLVSISRILKTKVKNIMPVAALTKIMVISIAAGAVVFVVAPLVRPLGDALVVVILGTLYSTVTLALFAYFNLANLGEILSWIKRTLAPKQI